MRHKVTPYTLVEAAEKILYGLLRNFIKLQAGERHADAETCLSLHSARSIGDRAQSELLLLLSRVLLRSQRHVRRSQRLGDGVLSFHGPGMLALDPLLLALCVPVATRKARHGSRALCWSLTVVCECELTSTLRRLGRP